MQNQNTSNRLLSRIEAAERLGVTVACLESWAHKGKPELPYCRVGKLSKYREDDIEAFLASRSASSAAAHRALVTA